VLAVAAQYLPGVLEHAIVIPIELGVVHLRVVVRAG
jgi:hypothetical protein